MTRYSSEKQNLTRDKYSIKKIITYSKDFQFTFKYLILVGITSYTLLYCYYDKRVYRYNFKTDMFLFVYTYEAKKRITMSANVIYKKVTLTHSKIKINSDFNQE